MPQRERAAKTGGPASLPLQRLQSLWFQVTGLLCNLECTHCLVDSSPSNRSMPFIPREMVRLHLGDAESLGVKEVYFTGGEPFLHREMTGILADALEVAPATVLTNGTLINEGMARKLGALAARSRYSLEIRVSMDHPDPVRNDAVRGDGAHARAVRALLLLQDAGLLPMVTATEYLMAPREGEEHAAYEVFRRMLLEAGVKRPRLKMIPVFPTGKLEEPSRGGAITETMMAGVDPMLLQCAATRVVTAEGVYACPILVGREVALLTRGRLSRGMGPVTLGHHACLTCYRTGMTCGNF